MNNETIFVKLISLVFKYCFKKIVALSINTNIFFAIFYYKIIPYLVPFLGKVNLSSNTKIRKVMKIK